LATMSGTMWECWKAQSGRGEVVRVDSGDFIILLSKWPWLVLAAVAVYLLLAVLGFALGRKVHLPGGLVLDPPVGKQASEDLERRLRGFNRILQRRNRFISFLGSCLRSLAAGLAEDGNTSEEVDGIVAATISFLPQCLSSADSEESFYRVACLVPDDADPNYLVMSFNCGFSYEEATRLRLPIAQTIAGRAYREGASGRPIYVPDVRRDSGYWVNPKGSEHYRTLYCICMEDGAGGKVVLSVDAVPVDGLTRDDRDAIQVVAALICVLMSVKRLFAEGR